MCTSESKRAIAGLLGFTAIELLLGLTLTVVLALAIMPLTVSLQGVGSRESDRAITLLQGRVAAARLERDLRLASAGRSPFLVEAALLEAGPSQVVFLGHANDDASLDLLEWELAGDSLMRRWGPCPSALPATFGHHLYVDSKTVLQGLRKGGTLAYVVDGRTLEGELAGEELGEVESVILRLAGEDEAGTWLDAVVAVARVGR